MVDEFTQTLLGSMVAVIMLGMGASLTPRDFYLALKRPSGLAIGLISQYGIMPLLGFALVLVLAVSDTIAIGILIMACMPGGTTSNIFTYFSRGNLALSVLMTVASTLAGVIMIPIILVVYATALSLDIPRDDIIAVLIVLLVPVAIGMVLRRLNANAGAVIEFFRRATGTGVHSGHHGNLDSAELAVSARYDRSNLFGGHRPRPCGYSHWISLCGCIAASPPDRTHDRAGNWDTEWAACNRDHPL